MYYYRLWIELSESTEESDCGGLKTKAAELQSLIRDKLMIIRHPDPCVTNINYSMIFQSCGGANHRGANHQNLLEVLNFIIEKLPGSHGLVYWSDDEDPENDGYRVIVIAGGQLHERSDPFLSLKNSTVGNGPP